MKNIRKYLAIGVFCCIVTYAMFAFGNWELNPGAWGGTARTSAVMVWVVGVLLICLNTDNE